jgi:hypothetical protein
VFAADFDVFMRHSAQIGSDMSCERGYVCLEGLTLFYTSAMGMHQMVRGSLTSIVVWFPFPVVSRHGGFEILNSAAMSGETETAARKSN